MKCNVNGVWIRCTGVNSAGAIKQHQDFLSRLDGAIKEAIAGGVGSCKQCDAPEVKGAHRYGPGEWEIVYECGGNTYTVRVRNASGAEERVGGTSCTVKCGDYEIGVNCG